MSNEKDKGSPPKNITIPMLGWEDTMSPLAGTCSDCGVVLLRLQQILDELPWLAWRLRPAIEEMKSIRDGIEETMERAFLYWNGDFWERLHELGFEDPEP